MSSREQNLIWCLMGISLGSLLTLVSGLVFIFVSKDRVLAAFENDALALVAWSVVLALVGAAIASAVYCALRFHAFKEEKAILEGRDARISDLQAEAKANGAEVTRLAAGIAFAERNAEAALRENGESWEHVKLCQSVLDRLSTLEGNPERVKQYVAEELGGGMARNADFGRAYHDLIRFGCIEGHPLEGDEASGYELRYPNLYVKVKRPDYPSLSERIKLEAMNEIEQRRRKEERMKVKLAGTR